MNAVRNRGPNVASAAKPAGLYWLVPGFTFSFVAGVVSAWALLVEILR